MNWFQLLTLIIPAVMQGVELVVSEKKAGKKKKKAVVDSVSAVIQAGVQSGKLRGSWKEVTPEFLGVMVELIGEAENLFSGLKAPMSSEGVNQP